MPPGPEGPPGKPRRGGEDGQRVRVQALDPGIHGPRLGAAPGNLVAQGVQLSRLAAHECVGGPRVPDGGDRQGLARAQPQSRLALGAAVALGPAVLAGPCSRPVAARHQLAAPDTRTRAYRRRAPTARHTSRSMLATMQRALQRTRPSHAERERALGAVKLRYREGRLGIEELEVLVERIYTTLRRSELAGYVWAMPLQTLRWLALRRARRLQATVLRFHFGHLRDPQRDRGGGLDVDRRGDVLAGRVPAPEYRPTGMARGALAATHARARSPRLVEGGSWQRRPNRRRPRAPRAKSTSTC